VDKGEQINRWIIVTWWMTDVLVYDADGCFKQIMARLTECLAWQARCRMRCYTV
jgi:hypothetical protein